MTPDYKIIGTGSKGNAVRIGNVMVDCGMPYKKMKDELYKVDALLITHTHTDHLNVSTFQKIREEFPRIKVFANYEVADKVHVDKIICKKPVSVRRGNVTIYPCIGEHDVLVSYFFIDFDGFLVFYATDTCKVENQTGRKVDLFLIECNYDEAKLKAIGSSYIKKGYDPFFNSYRHLSFQQARLFYYSNRRNNDTPMIELHMSERFR